MSRRVNIGLEGETPKKQVRYGLLDPPSSISSSLLSYAASSAIPAENPRSEEGRPKTSRHKQHPTPDEFADYVVPSPQRTRCQEEPASIIFNEVREGYVPSNFMKIYFRRPRLTPARNMKSL